MPLIIVVKDGHTLPFSGSSLFYIHIEKLDLAMMTSREETKPDFSKTENR
jgi:hypothetical protein